MTKYTQRFKQQVLDFYHQNGKNRSLTRQYFQLPQSTLARWIAKFNHNGINGLAVLGKKRCYSVEFKLKVIQAIKKGQCSAEAACFRFDIPSSGIISQWLQRFEKQGIDGLLLKPKGRPSMKLNSPKMPPTPKTEEERLRYRILELEAENAMLKKFDPGGEPISGGKTDTAFRPRVAVSNDGLSGDIEKTRYYAKYVEKRQLP
ncbi:helix-turn-helix domain-containing protein [Avibacterium paragallinarum]|uniref:helix-turn-helix domain-containing protein n=1 Tax=Avibacterium paragallinarum TaxID=728 RepID=UPI0003815439